MDAASPSPQPLQTPHLRKSRAGCKTCKARKVKCDEVRPLCGNCSRRFLSIDCCDYESAIPKIKRRRQIAPKNAMVTQGLALQRATKLPQALISLRPVTVSEDDAVRSFELRLMYHYTRTVCLELPDCSGKSSAEMWQERIPQIAFQSGIVMDAILAISALHLQAKTPKDTSLVAASTKYLDQTIRKHRKALPNVDHSLAEPLLIAAIVISNATWLHSHRALPHEKYSVPIHAYNMIRGIGSLFQYKQSLFERAGYGWCAHQEGLPILENVSPTNKLLIGSQQDMALLLDHFCITKSIDKVIYTKASDFVLWLYRAFVAGIESNILHRYISTMPALLPPRFVELLSINDPLAMAILARGLALLELCDYAWWVHGAGEYEVIRRDIYGMCGLMPSEYSWTMAWPVKILSGEIKS